MKLILLGTTGYHPNDRRHTPCMMLPEAGVVLDAGTAMFRVRDHLATATLDIFLTHAHLDHVVGLTFLLEIVYRKRVDRIVVHGREEKLQAIAEHLFSEHIFPVDPPFEMRPLADEVSLAGGGRLTHFPLEHPGGALGFRLDWPESSMAYVTDTTARADAPYIEQIRGVDLLLHECYFSDADKDLAELTGHSCISPVAEVARAADVGRLVLVHINPLVTDDSTIGLDVAKAIFPATEIGVDGMELEF